MSILIIRHGETALNAARVVQVPGTPLSERGQAQAQALARRLAAMGVGHILSSDQTRAHMTAEALARATGAALELCEALQERNFGEVRGTPYAELEQDIFAPDYAPPGGEDWEGFHARVDRAWDRVLERATGLGEQHLAVVTHGLVCRSLVGRRVLLPAELGPVPERWANTAVTIVDAAPPHMVRLVNCTRHLEGAIADDRRAVDGG